MHLTDDNFYIYAAHYYDNPQCFTTEEFEEDLKRIQYIKRLLNKYQNNKILNERLILNHVIVLHNCFGEVISNMLFCKLNGQSSNIKPFLEYLNIMPEFIQYNDKQIHKSQIYSNENISKILERI